MWETKNTWLDTITLLTVLFLLIYIHTFGSGIYHYNHDTMSFVFTGFKGIELPVFHIARSLDPGLAERSMFLQGSLPSRSAPWPSSQLHYERGQTPSPETHKESKN